MLRMNKSSDDYSSGSDYQSSYNASSSSMSADQHTLIGKHISIEGTIRAKEDLIIEGTMKGKIELREHQVTIGASANIEADIEANSVVVGGKMVGNIKALGKVAITEQADFTGDIKAKRIAIDDGAYVKASIELERGDKKATPPNTSKPVDAVIMSTNNSSENKTLKPTTPGAK